MSLLKQYQDLNQAYYRLEAEKSLIEQRYKACHYEGVVEQNAYLHAKVRHLESYFTRAQLNGMGVGQSPLDQTILEKRIKEALAELVSSGGCECGQMSADGKCAVCVAVGILRGKK